MLNPRALPIHHPSTVRRPIAVAVMVACGLFGAAMWSVGVEGLPMAIVFYAFGSVERLAQDLIHHVIGRAQATGGSVGDHDGARHLSERSLEKGALRL